MMRYKTLFMIADIDSLPLTSSLLCQAPGCGTSAFAWITYSKSTDCQIITRYCLCEPHTEITRDYWQRVAQIEAV